ncbi:MAG: response regulator transcription factor [Lachnospiraceae bacterium]|nr:response regulator transcription factor [Lachnospiraceae bacterium]
MNELLKAWGRPPCILTVDDDIYINDLVKEVLEREGCVVKQAWSGTEALLRIDSLQPEGPDMILLDLNLPGLSGEELLPRIKDIPVIVVSAKADVTGKVDLLMGGAVDYITKPFDTQELIARIFVQLRRLNVSGESGKDLMTYRSLKLDPDTHLVTVDGKEVKLTRTEYAILKILIKRPEQVVAKLTLLDEISNDTPDCTEDSLKIHVHNLRKKLDRVTETEYIHAVWGIGFMLSNQKPGAK